MAGINQVGKCPVTSTSSSDEFEGSDPEVQRTDAIGQCVIQIEDNAENALPVEQDQEPLELAWISPRLFLDFWRDVPRSEDARRFVRACCPRASERSITIAIRVWVVGIFIFGNLLSSIMWASSFFVSRRTPCG